MTCRRSEPARLFHLVFHQPEIPPNTGNAIRLVANVGARLHLIEPLGFSLDEKSVRRAGLDYHLLARVQTHASLEHFMQEVQPRQLYAFSSHARRLYTEARFQPGDALLFGSETRGLPDHILENLPESQRLTLPMCPGNRSLNLSNAAAVVTYEAWRQLDFAGCRP